jgi:hypothetical protein
MTILVVVRKWQKGQTLQDDTLPLSHIPSQMVNKDEQDVANNE